jgi:hypothetical protein
MRSTTPRIPQIQGIPRLELKPPQQLHEHLVQLHESNRLAQTLIFAMPKDEIVVPLHFLQPLGRGFMAMGFGGEDPAFWAEGIRVG